MALIQLEMLMVTLHKDSCLLASAQRDLSTCLFFPPVRKNPLFFTQINLLMRLKIFLDILSFPLKWKKKNRVEYPILPSPASQISPCSQGISAASKILK